jgi:hypothetical protein
VTDQTSTYPGANRHGDMQGDRAPMTSTPGGLHLPSSRYVLPVIEERTSYGFKRLDPYTKLFEERIIFLGQAIDDTIANDVMAQLLTLESMDPDRDISIYVNSPGGSFTALTAIYDTMNFVRPDIQTTCLGQAASAAAIILAALRAQSGNHAAQLRAYLVDTVGKPPERLRVVEPSLFFSGQTIQHAFAGAHVVERLLAHDYANRPTLNVHSLHVDYCHAEAIEKPHEGPHRVEIYVLMINRVEPCVVVHVHGIANFKDEDAIVSEQELDATHQILEVVDVRANIMRRDESCWPVFCKHAARQSGVEKVRYRRNALSRCVVRDLRSRIHSKHPVTELLEGAQCGAIVGANVDDQTAVGQFVLSANPLHIVAEVLDEDRRRARDVFVVALE